MIAALALFLAAQVAAAPPSPSAMTGDWVVVAISRVIAPDQHPGECFVEGRVEQVVHGRAYRGGDPIALSMRCRNGGFDRTALARAPEILTIQALRAEKRALVHVDAGGRVLDNGFYGLGG